VLPPPDGDDDPDGDCEPEDEGDDVEDPPPEDPDGVCGLEPPPEPPLDPDEDGEDDPPDDDGGMPLGIDVELVILQPATTTVAATSSSVGNPWVRCIWLGPCTGVGDSSRRRILLGCGECPAVHSQLRVRRRRRPTPPLPRRPPGRPRPSGV
jgi:hypothetical protein